MKKGYLKDFCFNIDTYSSFKCSFMVPHHKHKIAFDVKMLRACVKPPVGTHCNRVNLPGRIRRCFFSLTEMEAGPGIILAEGDGWRLTHTGKCLFLACMYSTNPSPAAGLLWSVISVTPARSKNYLTLLVTNSQLVRTDRSRIHTNLFVFHL